MQVLKKEIQDKILAVGVQEFSKQGFAGTGMREIAGKVGVGVGNLYRYFPNKDALFCAVVGPVVEELYAMLERHHGRGVDVAEMLREEYLRDVVGEYIALLQEERKRLKILLLGATGSSLEYFKTEFAERSTEQVRRWFWGNKKRHPQMHVRVSGLMLRMHTIWMFDLLEQLLIEEPKAEELQQIIEEYIQFEIHGWKQVLQLG